MKLHHWNYFLVIENDIEMISRFIEPAIENSNVYSHELARVLVTCTSEVDVLLKSLCVKIDPNSNAGSISRYEEFLRVHLPQIFEFTVNFPRWDMHLTPWQNWSQTNPPDWWTANNKVKHHRNTEYHQANLINVLNSFAALFICNLYFYRELALWGQLLPNPRIIQVNEVNFAGTTFQKNEHGINYAI